MHLQCTIHLCLSSRHTIPLCLNSRQGSRASREPRRGRIPRFSSRISHTIIWSSHSPMQRYQLPSSLVLRERCCLPVPTIHHNQQGQRRSLLPAQEERLLERRLTCMVTIL